jgi:hypothetical protein
LSSRREIDWLKSMGRTHEIGLVVLILGMSVAMAAQDNPPSSPSNAPTPAPTFGQTAPILSPENPPVTGLDEPGLDLHPASRSFISPAVQVSESADTNGGNALGGSQLQSVSRVLGAFDLQQFWPKSDLFLEYLGGGAFYNNPYEVRQLEAFGFEGITRWRTGQVTLRDAFSYLPDGAFELGFGGNPGLGIATGGAMGTGIPGIHAFGAGQFGSVGDIPRLTNTAILDAVQAINPVSAFTVAGAFSNAHFYDTPLSPLNPDPLLNSDQLTVEGGYSHLINRHDQIGFVYAFQLFQFPQLSGGELYLNIVNLRYSHTVSGKLSFLVSVGPQHTQVQDNGQASYWSLSARVQLRYKLGHASLVASYEKFTSPGSGIFAGANVQAARLGYTRPLGRTWEFYGDLNYSHNSQVQNVPGFGANASYYNEGSFGGIARRHLGRKWEFFAAYRFNELGFNDTVVFAGSRGNIEQRQVGTVGLEWHPRPTRIE